MQKNPRKNKCSWYQAISLIFLLLLGSCTPSIDNSKKSITLPTRTADPGVINSPAQEITPQPQILLENTSFPTSTNTASPGISSLEPIFTPINSSANTPTPLSADNWKSFAIIPTISKTAQEIYKHGIELGRDPHAFSKIGDCQSITTYFLKYFDMPGSYNLGDYGYLQETIDWFSGSFSRESMSVKGGFNAAAVLSPFRADPKLCQINETPIACEFRLHNPSIAIISLEEWWSEKPENYEKYLRQIIEYSIQNGVVPVLATKADNLEGNHLINQTIARLALEYDIPLWNFWLVVQPLPNHGLIAVDTSGNPDMFHLTRREGYYFFNNRVARRSGWALRNLTALQVLDVLRQGLIEQP